MTAFHFLKQAILLIACCSTLVQMVLASPAAEAAVDRSAACPAIEENTHAATWWQFESTDDGHVATLKNPMGAGSITVDLDMDGPSTPVLLGWEVLAQYDGSVGLLHYYSGATGSYVSADITRYIVINLDQFKLLANLEASVSLAGTRWLEQDDGSLEEEETLECQITALYWQPDQLIYSDGDGVDSLSLF